MECATPEALEYFVSLLDPNIIEYGKEELTIHAEQGSKLYIYLKEFGVFCIDGILNGVGTPA